MQPAALAASRKREANRSAPLAVNRVTLSRTCPASSHQSPGNEATQVRIKEREYATFNRTPAHTHTSNIRAIRYDNDRREETDTLLVRSYSRSSRTRLSMYIHNWPRIITPVPLFIVAARYNYHSKKGEKQQSRELRQARRLVRRILSTRISTYGNYAAANRREDEWSRRKS